VSIRYKFLLAFSVLVALACVVALVGFRGISASGDLAVQLYDGPLMGINHARSAHAALNEARLLVHPSLTGNPSKETVARFRKLLADIDDDLQIVRERVDSETVAAALQLAQRRAHDWSEIGLMILDPPAEGLTKVPLPFSIIEKSDKAAAALDDLVEIVAAYGFESRTQAETMVKASRRTMVGLAIGAVLTGLMLALVSSHSMSRPIYAAVQVAERVAGGDFSSTIASTRRDELGRLLRSLSAMQSHLKTRAEEDYAMMVKLDAALNNMTHGLCLFGPDDRLTLWNDRYLKMYGIAPDRIFAGCTLGEMLDAGKFAGSAYRDIAQFEARMRAATANRQPDGFIAELEDGRTVNVTYQPIQDGGWVSTHEDVTERKKNEARIEHLAYHDLLTDLPNRAAFNEHIEVVLGDAASRNEGFAVLCLDLDRFKEINDVYGHSAGDAYLVEIARRLTAMTEGAFLARVGGDEFVFVLAGGPQPDTAERLCGRLTSLSAIPFDVDGCNISGSFTIGVGIYPGDGSDADTLVANAEAALHRAKKQERGTVQFFEPAIDRGIREKHALRQDLMSALENSEFELNYQPQATTEGEAVGFEALLRWRHPTRGMVSPATFIPLAEETGLIGAIDQWVLREACREAATWPKPLAIAVNLSPINFRRGDIPGMILSTLVETGLNPERLEVEITEGILIDDFDHAMAILRQIKNLGVRIAMDDFGTGYSSLSYLQSFPFDKIKIDQTFIAKIGKNPQAAAIIHAIVGLAGVLGLPVIAEGVETEEQRAFLAREGCDEIQGYLIGRPLPISAYRNLVTVTQFAPTPEIAVAAG
jgi:diguanylate cyclase (GGDEF)-like protein